MLNRFKEYLGNYENIPSDGTLDLMLAGALSTVEAHCNTKFSPTVATETQDVSDIILLNSTPLITIDKVFIDDSLCREHENFSVDLANSSLSLFMHGQRAYIEYIFGYTKVPDIVLLVIFRLAKLELDSLTGVSGIISENFDSEYIYQRQADSGSKEYDSLIKRLAPFIQEKRQRKKTANAKVTFIRKTNCSVFDWER